MRKKEKPVNLQSNHLSQVISCAIYLMEQDKVFVSQRQFYLKHYTISIVYSHRQRKQQTGDDFTINKAF